MSRTDQEQKNGLKRRARAWVCIRVNVYIWVTCRNQESNEAFTQVLFAWQFRLVVKLTVLHLPFTQPYQPYSGSHHPTSPPIRSISISSNRSVHRTKSTPFLITGHRSPVTVTDSFLAKEWSYPRFHIITLVLSGYLESFTPSGVRARILLKSYPMHRTYSIRGLKVIRCWHVRQCSSVLASVLGIKSAPWSGVLRPVRIMSSNLVIDNPRVGPSPTT